MAAVNYATSYTPATHKKEPGAQGLPVNIDPSQVEQLKKTAKEALTATMQLVQQMAEDHPQEISSELQAALAQNPCWQVAQGATKGEGKPHASFNDLQNFFMIVFQYMQNHASADNKIEVCQALNMVAQNNLLDNLTSEAQQSVTSTQAEVGTADSDASNAFKKSLIMGICVSVGTAALLSGLGGSDAVVGYIAQVVGKTVTEGLSTAGAMALGSTIAAGGVTASVSVASARAQVYTTESSGDTSNMQAEMSLNSAASNNVQNNDKEDMQIEQNMMSDLQATLSMQLQVVQAATKVYNLGTI